MEVSRPEINSLWNYSKPKETREKFSELYRNEEASAPADYLLQLKTQLARTYSLVSEFDQAHEILDEVEQALNQETPVANVRYLLERGRSYNSAGEKDKAKNLFILAYNEAKAINAHNYAVDGAHMVAIASATLEEKLEWNNLGLSQAQKSNDNKVRSWVGAFYNNMGWDLFEAKRYQEALKMFESCRDFYKEVGADYQYQIALWSIGKTYRLLGRVDEALDMQETLLNENGGEDKSGYTYEELAELRLVKGDSEKSKSFFRKSYEILSKDIWLQKNESARLERIKNLSL